ncbi:hypothetical protein N2152v2_010095 [Parachlorella kessleri]
MTVAQDGRKRGDDKERREDDISRSKKGDSFEATASRTGRPAWGSRTPDDTPLRDGNRDRLLGLLTDRAARTLAYYFMELNPTLHNWLYIYLQENPIPKEGDWADVSGETFLRKLLGSPMEEARYNFGGRPAMFSCATPMGVDPRSIAQRIMEIRSQIAKEWIEELKQVSEENALLMRETVLSSFSLDNLAVAVADPAAIRNSTHPEVLEMQAALPELQVAPRRRKWDRSALDDSAAS